MANIAQLPSRFTAEMPFQFEEHNVRCVIDREGNPWFVLADACRAIEIENSRDAASRLDHDERGVVSTDTPGGQQNVIIINESGLYSLILTSRKEAARRFKKWVTAEVLPHIRKTGSYGKPVIDVRDPAQMNAIAIALYEDREKIKADLAVAAPKAAFFDRFVDVPGRFGLRAAAKILGMPPKKFINRLRTEHILFREGGELVPYAPYCEKEYFEVKMRLIDGKARHQTFVTQVGVAFLGKKWAITPHVEPDLFEPKGQEALPAPSV